MRIIFLFLCTFIAINVHSQTLSGTVYDENKQTIPGASVYLDGTSIGTITDDNGNYKLSVPNKINTILVISFIGYEAYFVQNPFENPIHKVQLVPKMTNLKEVTIVIDGFSRNDKLKIFRNQFLGTTKGGKSCKILNEDDISFQYNLKKNILTATSQNPLRIANKHLGYEISFNLIDFNIEFFKKSIKVSDVVSSYFAGTTAYKDVSNKNSTFISRRKKTYDGSQMLFFRNLIRNIWDKKQFELYNGSYPADPNDYFSVSQTDGHYNVTVKPNVAVKKDQLAPAGFYSTFNLMYNRKNQSKVIFRTANFAVDAFGNTDAPDAIMFAGEMSKYRMGDLLPLDFPG